MEKYQFTIKEETSIRHYLQQNLQFSRRHYRRVKSKAEIYINGFKHKITAPVKKGDEVIILLPSNKSFIEEYDYKVEVLYEDNYIIAVNKPAKMLTHPTYKEKTHTLLNVIKFIQSSNKQTYSFHPIHRLDRDTSGVIMIAKSAYTSKIFSELFEQRKVEKTYLTIVEGVPKCRKEIIDIPLLNHTTKMKQKSVTAYEVLNFWGNHSFLKVKPLTGRTHQIRRHLSDIGHPIVGDRIYNKDNFSKVRHLLHAFSLDFIHPIKRDKVIIKASLPNDFSQVIKECKQSQ
ncbi:RluA family pseudouridine synthase [Proteinivorax tanatarense]|uniref:Pseudouridine synthase n=1 Tax=Proteinivorax tanatarense TaxID=1260629 RepID=A0AAU7VIY7_9FIRM